MRSFFTTTAIACFLGAYAAELDTNATSPEFSLDLNTTRSGTASTTRYWDCAGAFCQPSLPKPYPHNRRPYRSADGRIFVHAAASDSILQGRAACDHCYEMTRPDKPGLPKVVVHVDNWCPCQYNPSCCKDHFDIAAPGFDYPSASVYSRTCGQTDPAIKLPGGHQACAYGSPSQCDCNQVSSDPALVDGCNVFKALECDNCVYNYNEIPCPF